MNTKTLISSVALALAAITGASAMAATGGNDSGQIIIRGQVGAICEIAVIDYGVTLDLVGGESARAVGRVVETCNNPEGYSLSLSSVEGGAMIGPLDTAVSYRVNYDELSSRSLASDAELQRTLPQWNLSHELTVDVDGQDELPAGEYRDIVKVTIAAS